jgi:predicted DNA-binding transcriptional regulator YafY
MREKKKIAKTERKKKKPMPVEQKEAILEYLKAHGWTKKNTPELYEAIGLKYRGLGDAFTYLEEVENLLIKEKIGKAFYWRLKDKNLVSEKLSQKDYNSLTYAIELEKKHFDHSTIKAIEKVFETNQEYMMGHLALYEEFQDSKITSFYDKLVDAIKHHKYLRLEFNYDKISIYNNVKPIKIVFIDNNWYITFEYKNDNERKFVFRRLVFLNSLEYLKDFKYSNKNTFQTKDIQKYLDFLADVQNSMTLYGVEPKKAKLKALPYIAKYFKDDMKKFLSTQKFIKEEEDGSVIFSVDYTQELEILPFVQKWMPDLIILEPQELRDAYKEKLQSALDFY